MKRFLALAIAVSAVSAHAVSDRAIYDIMYLPKVNTKYGITELGMQDRDIKGEGSTRDVDIKGWGVKQDIGFALTEKLTVNLHMEYLNAEIDQEGGSSFDQEGVTDPVASGRFRLMDEDLKLDLIGSLLMSIADGKIKTDNTGIISDMNNLQGGNAVSVGAQVGQQKENLQWAFLAQYKRNFEREYDIDNEDVKYKSNNDFFFRADLLNKLAEKSFLRSHVSTNFEERLDNKTSGYSDLFTPKTVYKLGTQYQHLCSSDLLLRGGVEYAIENSNNGQFGSDRAWTFSVGANYQF